MFAERDWRVLPIMRDKKHVHPWVHIIFSLTHARTPRVFKYLKRAGRANFRVYLKKIVSTHDDEIESKRHNEYQYSPLQAGGRRQEAGGKAGLSKFFLLL